MASLLSTPGVPGRDMYAARSFFARSLEVVEHAPEKVTNEGHDAYPRTIREALSEGAIRRRSQYRNNRIGSGPSGG